MSNSVIIDVREVDEFNGEHIEHAINIPLSLFAHVGPAMVAQFQDRTILLICKTGLRAQQAMGMLSQATHLEADHFDVYEGGIEEWKRQGRQLKIGKSTYSIPLMRQVMLTAGLLVLLFCLLALFIHPGFAYIALAIGGGLTMAGLTGFCPLAKLLARMPWNKV